VYLNQLYQKTETDSLAFSGEGTLVFYPKDTFFTPCTAENFSSLDSVQTHSQRANDNFFSIHQSRQQHGGNLFYSQSVAQQTSNALSLTEFNWFLPHIGLILFLLCILRSHYVRLYWLAGNSVIKGIYNSVNMTKINEQVNRIYFFLLMFCSCLIAGMMFTTLLPFFMPHKPIDSQYFIFFSVAGVVAFYTLHSLFLSIIGWLLNLKESSTVFKKALIRLFFGIMLFTFPFVVLNHYYPSWIWTGVCCFFILLLSVQWIRLIYRSFYKNLRWYGIILYFLAIEIIPILTAIKLLITIFL
jgi:hypothetical protein